VKRKIAVVTTSRADYSHLYWPLRDLAAHPQVDLRLIVLGSHLSPEFGATVREIEQQGLPIAARIECLLSSDSDVGMAKTIGIATLGLADSLGQMRPDILLLIADRYEMLAPAAAALALRIPIAHIEGGEISEGAIDDAVRNALTKMSHVHFTSTHEARRRVIAMGEEEWRVHRAGAPSLDHLQRSPLYARDELAARLGITLEASTIVAAYHPVTMTRDTLAEADAVFAALCELPDQILFCYPNADAGSRELSERIRAFVASRKTSHLFVNLDAPTYWSLLRQARLFVGNSSSGIMETPSFALPAVNVGLRQQGRERARNIVDAAPVTAAILDAIRTANSVEYRNSLRGMTNPYGDGCAAATIVRVLTTVPVGQELLLKRHAAPRALATSGPRATPGMRIPLSAPDVTAAEIEAVSAVLRTSQLSLGPKLEEFERAAASYIGVAHAIAVNSGTSGLHLCMRALGITAGDEVIVPSFSFVAVANAARYESATPVFVDIDPVTLNLDPAGVEAAITPRSRAIVVVHTFGVPAALAELMEIARRHRLFVIEDACEAFGAEYAGRKVGSFGDAGVFGFYPNKQITTGEGGVIVTDDPRFAAMARRLRNQGRGAAGDWFVHEEVGYNYRISEMSCALGVEQLKRIDAILARRAAVVGEYQHRLADHPDWELPPIALARRRISWFVYVVRLRGHCGAAHRDKVLAAMAARGIGCGRYFAPIHLQPAYRTQPHRCMDLSHTEAIAPRTLALPLFNRITSEQIEEVCQALDEMKCRGQA
jgi:UDP-hydrolysing UDP-N-acetyl-D-glucosamine 2-epimerase